MPCEVLTLDYLPNHGWLYKVDDRLFITEV